jgi:hypothetical protein
MSETTHIRIPREIKGKLQELARDGESIGSVIARLVASCEKGNPPDAGSDLSPDSNLAGRMITLEQWKDEIEDRIRTLEMLVSEHEMQNSPIPIEVFIDSSDSPDPVPLDPIPAGWIILTREMREQMVDAVEILRRKEIPLQQIADAIAMPVRTLKRIISPAGNPKRVTMTQYERLIDLVKSPKTDN